MSIRKLTFTIMANSQIMSKDSIHIPEAARKPDGMAICITRNGILKQCRMGERRAEIVAMPISPRSRSGEFQK